MEQIKTRQSNLVVQELQNEILIYDLDKNKALSLNGTASAVWRLCDGEKSVTEISRIMSRELNSPISEDLVWLALDQLQKENLLENTQTIKSKFEGISRREVIRKVGLATMVALPVISSIVAPTALHAQSGGCIIDGQEHCIEAQPDIAACIDAIVPQEMTVCCAGTFTVITFDNPTGSNSCCGTCGPRIG